MCVSVAPGTPLLDAASAAGVAIATGCGSGSCGTCELELRVEYPSGAAPTDPPEEAAPGERVARACVTRLPSYAVAPRGALVTVSLFADDDVWGAS